MKIGLIADGNRRWAQKNGRAVREGHEAGFRAITDAVLPACLGYKNIDALAVYAFSTENWKRSPLEVKHLFELYSCMIDEWRDKFEKEQICLRWAGRREKINTALRKKIEALEEETQYYAKFIVYLCLDYGAHNEIARTAYDVQGSAIASADDLEKEITKNLEVPALDIIIRSGGEQRLSNFCLWQASYAELFFEPEFLPDFTKEKMQSIFQRFSERNRRRGK